MASPMVRKKQQVDSILELVSKVYDKMSPRDRRFFVRALSERLALKMSPADRDEWIDRMQKNLTGKTV